jgi:hypothetical protein
MKTDPHPRLRPSVAELRGQRLPSAGCLVAVLAGAFACWSGICGGELAAQPGAFPATPSAPPELHCLDGASASRAIVDDTDDQFFARLRHLEIAAMTKTSQRDRSLDEARLFARRYFAGSTRDFTAEEQATLHWLIGEIHRRLEPYHFFLARPWSIMKVQGDLCGGFSFTRGDHIVLGEKNIRKLVQTKREDPAASIRQFGSLLVHERMHVLQRRHAEKFRPLYEQYLGWRYSNVVMLDEFDQKQIANPDGQDENWVVPMPGEPSAELPARAEGATSFWLGTVLANGVEVPRMGADFVNVAVPLVPQPRGGFSMKTDENGHVILIPWTELPQLGRHFPVAMGWDHPHEMSARMCEALMRDRLTSSPARPADDAQHIRELAKLYPSASLAFAWLAENLK